MLTRGRILMIAMALALVAFAGVFMGLKWLDEMRLSNKVSKTDGMEKRERISAASVSGLQDRYDVIVVGTDPEGVAAAVSASRNGAKTLLIEPRTGREVLGGLMTVGWLNSIDMNWDKTVRSPGKGEGPYFNKGIFTEWYEQIEGHSFDVTTAANAFYELVRAEPNIDLYMTGAAIEPVTAVVNEMIVVRGMKVTLQDGTEQTILADSVIDATQDADFAAAAGVPFTIGREDLGDPDSRMAVTAVFRLRNVDDRSWKMIAKRLDSNGDSAVSGINNWTAWGYDKEMKGYEPINKERTAMRGLNIGRQRDGTVLINALHIFGIDGLDEASRQEGLEIARREIPHVIEYLKQYEEFANIELDAVAPELYVRETRHMIGLYRLGVVDLLENRDQWDRIAFGSYSSDIQRTSPDNYGTVAVHPLKYAVPFRSIVPKGVDGLLVVGRSASFDTLAHGSARVIPVGMATGQAAGAAAVLAPEEGASFQEMAQSKEIIGKLQERLNNQGMELEPYELPQQPYMKHKAYPGLRVAVEMGVASGGYRNEAFSLDEPSNTQRMVNMMNAAGKEHPDRLPGKPADALSGISAPEKTPLGLQQAALTIAYALGVETDRDNALSELEKRGILTSASLQLIDDRDRLTDGETYLLLRDVMNSIGGETT
ncbi:FAD-dependent oxidoreductase [Paenibacillus spongiae]|uniref:FAD-dependent oxidoreductase n=1 Tax=Paenibacillus spongiae TaxID=2909671 RepID=A0ABY5S9X6_9BACL|nr:FAD-dependent oxidoreductase [Paenibacillus spongiae]UVI29523.1 FAD-dependent oxidoreductase [Paenibacillus spongiae]